MEPCKDYGSLIKGESIIQSVNYTELMDLFNNLDSGIVFIGGAWCKNCCSVIDVVNELAKENGLGIVYHFDPKFINVFKEEDDLRDCKTLEVKLNYYYLVEKLGFKSEELVVDTLIPRIHVPFIFSIKNGTCTGYMSYELIMDDYLHYENDDKDMTAEFKDKLVELIKNI